MYRRLQSSKVKNDDNSNVAQGPYEMISVSTNQPVYTTIQSGASAPAESKNAAQPSAPPARSSLHDITLIDNDLYSK